MEIRRRVLRAGGIDISQYRDQCVLRRLAARVRAVGVRDLAGYCRRLDLDPGELDRLVEALTVNVSEFFRSPGTFRALAREVVPALLARKRAEGHRVLRVWSAGCAAGQEPYSLAITLAEALGGAPGGVRLALFATDVDEASLGAARRGVYPPAALGRVPRLILRRHFTAEGTGYAVRPALRGLVRFRRHDLAGPAPFGRLDLVVCRNVLIYMARPLQERVLETFFAALNPGGYLVLGKVEGMVGAARSRFEVVNLAERIYRRPPAAPAPAAGRRAGEWTGAAVPAESPAC